MPEVQECVGMEYMIDPKKIRKQQGQPRSYFSKAGLQELADSIEIKGQEQSITVIPVAEDPDADFELVDGERRWRVFRDHLKRPIRAIVRTNLEPGIDQFISSTVANFCREPHTPLEIAFALERIRREKGYTLEQLGKLHGKTGGWANQHLSLLRLHPSIQKLMNPELPKDQRLTFSVAIMLVALDEEEQAKMAARIVKHKWKLNRARHEIRMRAQDLGSVSESGRKRKPIDDYRILERFLVRIEQDAELLLGLKAKRFDEMFAQRTRLEREIMVKNVDGCIESLSLIKQQIQRTSGSGQ